MGQVLSVQCVLDKLWVIENGGSNRRDLVSLD